MPSPRLTKVIDVCRTLTSLNVPPAEIVANLATALSQPWVETESDWRTGLNQILELNPNSEIIFAVALPNTLNSSTLTWPIVFQVLGGVPNLDRFEIIRSILHLYKNGLVSIAFLTDCFGYLPHAGIHPASLVLCSFPTLKAEDTAYLLTQLKRYPNLKKFKDIDPFPSDEWQGHGIEHWSIRARPNQDWTGLISIRSVHFFMSLDSSVPKKTSGVLGNQMVIVGDLKIDNVLHVALIGNNIEIFGTFYIFEAANLNNLGHGIVIHENMEIRNCENLSGLPPDLNIEGTIVVSGEPADFDCGRLSEKWQPRFTFCTSYGQTKCSPAALNLIKGV